MLQNPDIRPSAEAFTNSTWEKFAFSTPPHVTEMVKDGKL